MCSDRRSYGSFGNYDHFQTLRFFGIVSPIERCPTSIIRDARGTQNWSTWSIVYIGRHFHWCIFFCDFSCVKCRRLSLSRSVCVCGTFHCVRSSDGTIWWIRFRISVVHIKSKYLCMRREQLSKTQFYYLVCCMAAARRYCLNSNRKSHAVFPFYVFCSRSLRMFAAAATAAGHIDAGQRQFRSQFARAASTDSTNLFSSRPPSSCQI